jgi:hypothetical protein
LDRTKRNAGMIRRPVRRPEAGTAALRHAAGSLPADREIP